MLEKVKKLIKAEVVKISSNKTVSVKVWRVYRHPLLGKVLRRSSHYLVHDENNVSKIGDIVYITQTSPKSKKKFWEIVQKS